MLMVFMVHYIHVQINEVPQGYILNPLLLILHIDELTYAFQNTYCVIFTDDTNIFYKNKNFSFHFLYKDMNKELK